MSKRGVEEGKEEKVDQPEFTEALCASCDRCRFRKTKCDGQRPCTNCVAKYMKQNGVKSIEGVDLAQFECVYSPAKRRGPQPGKAKDRKSPGESMEEKMAAHDEAMLNYGPDMLSSIPQDSQMDDMTLQILLAQQQHAQAHSQVQLMPPSLQAGMDQGGWGGGNVGGVYDTAGLVSAGVGANDGMGMQQQLDYLAQLQSRLSQNVVDLEQEFQVGQSAAQRIRVEPSQETSSSFLPETISAHLQLLSRDSMDGNRLRAYFTLSVDELVALPPIPTDEEFCTRFNYPGPRLLPKGLQFALMAARFAEVALGALVHDEVPLAMELCNATVHCLRECVQEPVDQSYLFEVSRSYFLLGVFRSFRGDLDRYLKYRRVCMTHLSQLQDDDAPVVGTEQLLSAISFLDAWAYMMHNADEKALPNIDDTIPPVVQSSNVPSTETEKKYDVRTAPACIAADPKNQVWIQGAPPVFLNNEAPLPARVLDALSCAIRSCCDQANHRFDALERAATQDGSGTGGGMCEVSHTSTAVLHHQEELCSRNMVLSAFTLLQQFEASASSPQRNQGLHLVISAMDAFLENGDEESGFTDSQIQSLLNVCNTVIENPLLLHHGGPTYHLVSNATILLCHLLNGMHAMRGTNESANQDMETAVFEEILDTFMSSRKLLNIHRRKLPVKLRCHGIPRPNVMGPIPGKPFIDLGETLMCSCRGCQGFVLMACSPCVAAERARAANNKMEGVVAQAALVDEAEDFDKEILDMGAEFDLDDDVLLNMLSRIITA